MTVILGGQLVLLLWDKNCKTKSHAWDLSSKSLINTPLVINIVKMFIVYSWKKGIIPTFNTL